jgi:exopolyphosphatase / guanosine-5'-triphosphate,3'-diphosphate pyrophosphatase
MVVSEFALREGVLLDRFGGAPHVGLERLGDLRNSNVRRLARQLDPDPDHGLRTADLAMQLCDRTARLHGLGPAEREILWSAAVVHNVGLFISHSSHHKHTYYVVRNSEHLTGFTEHEIELMALVARYHRKSHPSAKHSEFAALSPADQQVVTVLAGLLRIAIGFDRRHAGVVLAVRVHVEPGGSITIEPVGAPGVDLDIEVYGAMDRSGLLGKALGLDVHIRAASPVP